MRIYSSEIVVLNKISGGGTMDSATVSFENRTISMTSTEGTKMQKIVAVQIADI